MLTWMRFWPVFVGPVLLLNVLGFLPTVFEGGRYWGGGPIRQWMLNTLLIPLLNVSQAEQIVQWFNEASVLQECVMYGILILNLDLLLMPVFYGFGQGIMRVLNWMTVKDLALKRQAAR